jgi:hypothetical protein
LNADRNIADVYLIVEKMVAGLDLIAAGPNVAPDNAAQSVPTFDPDGAAPDITIG